MARKEGEKKLQAGDGSGTGDGARNEGVEAEAGADLASPKRGYAPAHRSATAREGAKASFDAAYAHAAAGRIAQAETICRRILTSDPTHAEALHLLGGIATQKGSARFAIELFKQALKAKPGFAKAHANLGALLMNRGEAEEAVDHFEKAIKSEPDFALAHNNLGIALKAQGKFEAAVASYRKAIALKPNYAEAHNNLGNALASKGQGKFEAAVASYRKAIALKPNYADAHYNLGNVLKTQGNFEATVASYRKAIALKPNYPEAHNNLGNALKDQGRLKEAVASYRKATALKPNYAEAHYNLGNALASKDQGKFEAAVASYQKAIALKPNYADAHNKLGIALRAQGKFEAAVTSSQKAIALKPDHPQAHSNLLLCMNYDRRFTAQDIFAESRRWNEVHASPRAARERAHANKRDPDRRLRVGYVSPDFREHPASYFFEPLTRAHDRRSFEVFCYAEVAEPDDKTARFLGLADGWRSTVGMTDAAVAERVREDDIDILVDLAGHTAKNRLLVFAERPAPVQVTWLGYPNTTGLSAMDYRLTDAIADPEGTADAVHSETLVRLPGGFLCFAPPANAPEVAAPPALANGDVTFGSFNNLAKVTPEVVATWARILERVPGSRLLIKSPSHGDEETRKHYVEMSAAHGIEPGRIELVSRTPSKSGHLAAYEKVDIALDPFPYNGATTSCEALWMGVPMITLCGDRHAGRVGASILTRVALTEFVAATKEAYVDKAVGLAKDLRRLSVLRKELRGRVQGSPLGDAEGFAREVEAAYRAMWRRWCDGGRGRPGASGRQPAP